MGGFFDGLAEDALTEFLVKLLGGIFTIFRATNLLVEPGVEALTTATAGFGEFRFVRGKIQTVLPLRVFQQLLE